MASVRSLRRLFAFLLVFLLLFCGGLYSPVHAAEGTETPSPTFTPASSATFTQIPTDTPTATSTPTPTSTELVPSPSATHTSTSTTTPTLKVPVLRGDYVEDEVLVRFAQVPQGAQSAASACYVNEQVEVVRELDAVGVSLLKIRSGSVAEFIAAAENCPEIIYAEPNYELHALDTFPNDPNWSLQYGLTAIHAPQGWDLDTGAATVVIAVLDTGVDLTHPDLMPKLVAGYDFVNDDAVPQDDNGHGTHVAGIAAAGSNNGTGVSGVSWGARIMPVKVLNASANGSFAHAAAGIIWAADHGAHIINMSLGGSSHSQIFEDAVDYAYGKGVMLIASSGNNGSGFVLYPARFSNVLAIGATDSSNVRAGFSNYGPELDVVAPGVSIYSTVLGSYNYDSGTSMSAPFVSGLAAILRGLPGSGSPANLAWAIKSTALDLGAAGRDDYYGDGLIQMDAAIQLLWVTPTFTPTEESEAPEQPDVWLVPNNPDVMPTWTFTPTPTQTPATTPTDFATPSPLPTDPEQGDEPDLFALSTPTEMQASFAPPAKIAYSPPCLGAFLILLGILLFWFGNRWRKGAQIP